MTFCLQLGRRFRNVPLTDEEKIVKFGDATVDFTKFVCLLYVYNEKQSNEDVQKTDCYVIQCAGWEPNKEEREAKILAFSSISCKDLNEFDKRLRWVIDGRISKEIYDEETKSLKLQLSF